MDVFFSAAVNANCFFLVSARETGKDVLKSAALLERLRSDFLALLALELIAAYQECLGRPSPSHEFA